MTKKLGVATVLVAALTMAAVFGMHAFGGSGKRNVSADMLTGYQEEGNTLQIQICHPKVNRRF